MQHLSWESPNPKLQAPEKSQPPSSRSQKSPKTQISRCLPKLERRFGIWNFELFWSLGFGAWCLVLGVSAPGQPPTTNYEPLVRPLGFVRHQRDQLLRPPNPRGRNGTHSQRM